MQRLLPGAQGVDRRVAPALENPAARWRMALARRVGEAYAANPKARVVMAAGSTGRGTADRFSDLEIDVYWNEPPTDEERRQIAAATGGELLDLAPYEEDEWAETISFGGFHVGTSTFLVETMERYLRQVLEEHDPDPLAQMRLFSVLNAETLTGHALVDRWRARARRYPAELARRVVEQNLEFDGFGYGEEMMAARDDLLPLYSTTAEVERQVLAALLGLNRIYLPNPSFKRLDELLGSMQHAPADLAVRLRAAFRLPPAQGVQMLHAVIADVFELVDRHMPEIDTAPYRARMQERRGVWVEPPAGFGL